MHVVEEQHQAPRARGPGERALEVRGLHSLLRRDRPQQGVLPREVLDHPRIVRALPPHARAVERQLGLAHAGVEQRRVQHHERTLPARSHRSEQPPDVFCPDVLERIGLPRLERRLQGVEPGERPLEQQGTP